MTADKQLSMYRKFSLAVGWADVLIVVVLIAFSSRLLAQSSQRQTQEDRRYDVQPRDSVNVGERVSRMEVEIDDLQQKQLEESRASMAANVEGRLSRLEATQDINNKLLITIACAISLLLLEAGQRRFAGRIGLK